LNQIVEHDSNRNWIESWFDFAHHWCLRELSRGTAMKNPWL